MKKLYHAFSDTYTSRLLAAEQFLRDDEDEDDGGKRIKIPISPVPSSDKPYSLV